MPDFQFFQLLSQPLDDEVQLDWAKYRYFDAPGSTTAIGICPTPDPSWPKGICPEVSSHNPDTAESRIHGQGTPARVMGLLGNECGTETFAEKARSQGCCVWKFLASA